MSLAYAHNILLFALNIKEFRSVVIFEWLQP